jgi:hypothetical protein
VFHPPQLLAGLPGLPRPLEQPIPRPHCLPPLGRHAGDGGVFWARLFDRYPNLRFAILESGFGWIPFWATRLQDQAHYLGFVADGLQHTMLEYTTGGRFLASIVMHEGGQMVKLVSGYLGDHFMMFN